MCFEWFWLTHYRRSSCAFLFITALTKPHCSIVFVEPCRSTVLVEPCFSNALAEPCCSTVLVDPYCSTALAELCCSTVLAEPQYPSLLTKPHHPIILTERLYSRYNLSKYCIIHPVCNIILILLADSHMERVRASSSWVLCHA